MSFKLYSLIRPYWALQTRRMWVVVKIIVPFGSPNC